MLNVPFREQISETACGVAAFEMVYRYFKPSKLTKFSQSKVYRRLESDTPDRSNKRVNAEDLVTLARERNFYSGWGRVNPNPIRLIEQVKFFIETQMVPLIVCQQWHGDSSLGHFRVVVAIDNKEVIFHDPEPKVGGANLRFPLIEFINQWRIKPGGNVTGGVAIWIAERMIQSPLDPDQPNLWVGAL